MLSALWTWCSMEKCEVYGIEIPAHIVDEVIAYLCEEVASTTYSLHGKDILKSVLSSIASRDY